MLAIAQTRDGYVWLGTEEGLARFDGVHFTIFNSANTPELKSDSIRALLVDGRGGLWIGTMSGLVRYGGGIFTAEQSGFAGQIISSLYEDPEGGIWVGTDGAGIGRLLNGRLTTYGTQNGLASNAVFSVSGRQDGSIWIGTHCGLSRWAIGQFTTYTTKNGLPSDDIRAVSVDERGDVWIGTHSGLSRFANGTLTTYNKTKSGLSSDMIQSLYEDREHTLWIGTMGGGLDRLRDGAFTSYTSKDGLLSDDVMSIGGDEEGSLWVGTVGGLNRFGQGKVLTYTSKDGLPSDILLATYEDHEGNLWLGTADHGVARLRDGKVAVYGTEQGLPNNTVFSVTEDRSHNLWIATRKGLSQFRNGRFTTYTAKDGLASDIVMVTYLDREGTLWAGGRGGISRFQDGHFTAYAVRDGSPSILVSSIVQDAAGALWIGTNIGLSRFKDGRFDHFTCKNSALSSDLVMSLYEDSEGVLWIGTYGGGLDRLKNGKITSVAEKQGLFDNKVLAILEGDDGNLWMSSNRGIFRVRKEQLNDFADGRIHSIDSIALGTEDGMKTKECNGGFQPAGWKTKEGKLVFPTMKGAVIVDPRTLAVAPAAPPVVIEGAAVDKKSVPVEALIVSPPSRGELEFQYTAPSFISPHKIKFQYQLEGYDREWVDAAGRRVVHYTNIAPGAYRFRIRASNGDGRWTGEGLTLNLVLQPHFYQTYWFYIACALTGLVLAATVFHLRLRQLKVRQRELIVLVDERTTELQREILVRKQAEEDLKQARDAAIQAREALRIQATHDALTGTWNRGALLELLGSELHRGKRTQIPTALLMLDLDHFKKINDTYGHLSGDAVLREVARRISEAVRGYDFVGRYGGEEFLVVLPDCDIKQATQTAERIRTAISANPILATSFEIMVTASIGATATLSNDVTEMEILAIADDALYQAKNAGRNCTVAADSDPGTKGGCRDSLIILG